MVAHYAIIDATRDFELPLVSVYYTVCTYDTESFYDPDESTHLCCSTSYTSPGVNLLMPVCAHIIKDVVRA